MGLISEKAEVLQAELNEGVKIATSCYSTAGDFLQCIYSVIVATNHQKFRSVQGVWFMNVPSLIFFNDINHGYREAVLKFLANIRNNVGISKNIE